MKDQVTTLYRYFGSADELLYVGISFSWPHRNRQHEAEAHWFDAVTSVKLQRFPNRRMALDAEKAAIKAENPLCNLEHNEGRGRKAYSVATVVSYVPEESLEVPPPDKFCHSALWWASSGFDHLHPYWAYVCAIGVIHAEYPLCFELEDENDIDSMKEELPADIKDLYEALIDMAISRGATGHQIGEAYSPGYAAHMDAHAKSYKASAASTILAPPQPAKEPTCQ